ncbi:hypothetical protein skT53_35160 [Effusibacillus dendaii]|uniref:LysM domain-containing protein n=1 Tax=Effusibacillus dendaii TaxID=2743772 RepID=A0A7I8DKT4_9BACL|nr:hypothetical protein skT53_35160 [Effusibacillus dendaii]
MFVYTVKPGDSLFLISQKYDIPIDTIRAVNGLTENNVVPGLALLITNRYYTVQPGDTLYSI